MVAAVDKPALFPSSDYLLNDIEAAIEDIRAGKPVVVVDNVDRENEGDLIFAAEKVSAELVAFMVRHTSGYICVALLNEALERLKLPPMVAVNEDSRQTAYAVTVDAATGSTGISAQSRAETIRRLADPDSVAGDFTRPGHVVPLRARANGVLDRDGHTEASVDLARLAGLRPAGVLCEIVSEDDPTDMARGPELRRFADTHGLKLISIKDLIAYRQSHEQVVRRETVTSLPTEFGDFTAVAYTNVIDGVEHVALVAGDPSELQGRDDVLVRMHSECLTGDTFGSRRCDCGPQLHAAMEAVQKAGSGVVVYLRGQEGRGIGLVAKLKAYSLQDSGLDTVDANVEQGLPEDAREYSSGVSILHDLGIRSVKLMSNNPAKVDALEALGMPVNERVALTIEPNEDNIAYLKTKRERMGHDLPHLDAWATTATASTAISDTDLSED